MRPSRLTATIVLLAATATTTGTAGGQDTASNPRVTMHAVVLPFDQPFTIVGAAADELVRLQAWYSQRSIDREACRRAGPPVFDSTAKPQAVRHAEWERMADEDTFELQIGELPPNRQYSFCYRYLVSLNATDSTAYQARMQQALAAALTRWIDSTGGKDMDVAALRQFQAAMIAAIPAADATERRRGGIFDPAADDGTLRSTFVTLMQAVDYRMSVAGNLTRYATPEDTGSFAGQLVRIGADTLLRHLAAVPEVTSQSAGEKARMASGREVAGRLRGLSESEAAGVASGVHRISSPRVLSEPLGIERRKPAEAATWAENMDTTLARLQDLRDLVRSQLDAAPARTAAQQAARRQLESLDARLRQLQAEAARVRGGLRQLQTGSAGVDTVVARVSGQVVARQGRNLLLQRTTLANYGTRARQRISQDLGFLYAWKDGRQDATPYVGVNVYSVPVNKNVPVSRYGLLDRRRWSLTVGLTTNDVEEEDRYKGIVGDKALVVGIGTRLSDFFRVSYGAPLVYTYSPDTDRRKRLTAMQYVSVAIDAELRDVIKGLADALFGT